MLKNSEASYLRMTVTFSKAAELDAIFAPTGADLTSIFGGYNSSNWIYKGNTEDPAANTRTYEFWYKEAVAAPDQDVALDALFENITVPRQVTNSQLDSIKEMTDQNPMLRHSIRWLCKCRSRLGCIPAE